jgi:hypothetical protein
MDYTRQISLFALVRSSYRYDYMRTHRLDLEQTTPYKKSQHASSLHSRSKQLYKSSTPLPSSTSNLVSVTAAAMSPSFLFHMRTGLVARLRQFPFLAGSLDVPDSKSGELRLLYDIVISLYQSRSSYISTPVCDKRAEWAGEGGVMVLPRTRNGDWEVMVCLGASEMTRLVSERTKT